MSYDISPLSDLLHPLWHSLGPAAAAAAKSLQSCLTLCDPIDSSPQGSPVLGILQASRLVGPCGHKELDMTERLHFHFSLSCIGEGNGNPLQYSCLENPRDRGALWAAVYGVAQSRTRLKRLSSSSSSITDSALTFWSFLIIQVELLCSQLKSWWSLGCRFNTDII